MANDGPEQYPIPIYLNEKYVLDIMAMMEDGFSRLQTVKISSSQHEDQNNGLGAQLGVKAALGLFDLSLGGDRHKNQGSGESTEVAVEKVHTIGSLFAKMRGRLTEQGLVKTAVTDDIAAGMFVELRVSLRKNPLIEALETMVSISRLATVATENPQPTKGQQHKPNQGSATGQLDKILKEMTASPTLDLIGEARDSLGVQMVTTLSLEYLPDNSLSDLVDGEYRIFGKVTRVLLKNDDVTTINLLRKTDLGTVSGDLLKQFISSFDGLQASGIRVPAIVTEIHAPAIQILPIAIFA